MRWTLLWIWFGAIGAIAHAQIGSGLWPDATALRDPSTLNVQIVRQWSTTINLRTVQMTEFFYNSWEVRNGVVRTVPVHTFLAVPSGGGTRPAVILAHGLGGTADADATARFAVKHDVIALSYTAPGNGLSGGERFTLELLFDTYPDARGSWFWAHAVAGSRAITLLSQLPNVNPNLIAMSGYSAGAMAALNVNGFDNRLRAVIAISGTGGLRRSAQDGSWVVHLLAGAGLTPNAPQFQRLCDTVDPLNQAGSQHAPVMLINGAQDEFFPLTSTLQTFNAFPGTNHRIVIIPNWDHGLFTLNLPAPYETFDNSEFANRRIEAATAFWIGRHLHNRSDYPNVPPIPTAAIYDYLGNTALSGTLSTTYQVVEVHVYFSNDRSWLYGGQRMTDRAGSTWYKLVTGLPWSQFNPSNTVYFSEFRLRNSALAPEFWLTSVPALPPGFVPRIRPMPNPPRTPGDVDGNGCVNDADLLRVLFSFGNTGGNLPEDLNGDGRVDDADLLRVLFNFGFGC